MSAGRPRPKILVVDDDEDTAELVARSLKRDYEIVIAHDGIEGVERAAEEHPDLVITDVDMPRCGGLELARHLRANPRLRVPIIFLSGRGDARDIIAGIAAGARHYLVKPIEMVELRQRVDVILSRKK